MISLIDSQDRHRAKHVNGTVSASDRLIDDQQLFYLPSSFSVKMPRKELWLVIAAAAVPLCWAWTTCLPRIDRPKQVWQRSPNKSAQYSPLPLLYLSSWETKEEEAEGGTIDAPSCLVRAGNLLKGINERAGSAICRAGNCWTSDWSEVAEALEDAANAFWEMSKKGISPKLQNICRSVAQELEDISTIEGCTSVGPVTSVPNWIEIQDYLSSAAADFESGTDDRDKHIFDVLKKTGREVENLIETI